MGEEKPPKKGYISFDELQEILDKQSDLGLYLFVGSIIIIVLKVVQ